MTERREIVEGQVLDRLHVKLLGQLAEELRLLDTVDTQVSFQIGIEFDDLWRITGLLDHEADQELFQIGRVGRTRFLRFRYRSSDGLRGYDGLRLRSDNWGGHDRCGRWCGPCRWWRRLNGRSDRRHTRWLGTRYRWRRSRCGSARHAIHARWGMLV